MTRSLLVVTTAFAAVVAAVPAHADDSSYLAKLDQSGVAIPMSENVRLTTGHYLCGRMRVNATEADLVRELTHVFFESPEAAVVQIDNARTDLCPDAPHR